MRLRFILIFAFVCLQASSLMGFSFSTEHINVFVGEKLKDLPCMGAHPDTVVGNYQLKSGFYDVGIYFKKDGYFFSNFGAIFGSKTCGYGHWDITEDNVLILNTILPQIDIEELYIYRPENDYLFFFFEDYVVNELSPIKDSVVNLNSATLLIVSGHCGQNRPECDFSCSN